MIQFRDCPHCYKRIRVDASRCHRCYNSVPKWDTLTDEVNVAEEQFATGGYVDDDDFDYDGFIENEFGNRPRQRHRIWYWVVWLLIALLLLGGLVTAF